MGHIGVSSMENNGVSLRCLKFHLATDLRHLIPKLAMLTLGVHYEPLASD